MKLVKLLSLAAVAAIAAMAFVGVSSAFAKENVVLCKKPILECTNPADQWPDPTTIVAHATTPKLLSSVGTVECEKSLMEVTLLNLLAKLILGHVLALSFEGNCKLGSTKCEVTVKELGGISFTHGPNLLEWIVKGALLWLTIEGKEVPMHTVVNVKCGFIINCTYSAGEETQASATASGTGEVTVTATKAELKRTAGFCPEVSEWDATYTVLGAELYLES
jgi:hypothetical protein